MPRSTYFSVEYFVYFAINILLDYKHKRTANENQLSPFRFSTVTPFQILDNAIEEEREETGKINSTSNILYNRLKEIQLFIVPFILIMIYVLY